MKKIILVITVLMAQGVWAADYKKGDGTLDFVCSPVDILNAKPVNYFDLTLMYDADTGPSLEDTDLGYKMQVTQYPFFGAEILSLPQDVRGCEFAELSMEDKGDSVIELYFECDGDGDAGYGSLTVDMGKDTVEGSINFPEGQSSLMYPLEEDTNVDVSCSFKE